jgi:hypothetical protein
MMKYLYIVLAITAILLIIGACKGTKKSVVASSKSPIIVFKKGKCFGKCKAYSFSLYEDYSADFNGTKNVDFIGEYKAIVAESVYNDLIAQLSAANLEDMQNEYLSNARDLPEIEITCNGKTIRFNNQKAPEELRQLGKQLEKVALAQTWVQSN